jgi:hypothetical protein
MRAPRLTLLPLALWLVSGSATAATVYKWVDAQGVTHYSDQPHPEAKTIDVEPKNTVSSTPAAAPTSTARPADAAETTRYRCEIIRPENDEVFLNTSTVSTRVRLEPNLAPGDQVAIAVDGKRQTNQPTTGTEFLLAEMERGTHSLMFVVFDRTGKKELCTTPAVTFHVRQPSTQAPVKATRPRF